MPFRRRAVPLLAVPLALLVSCSSTESSSSSTVDAATSTDVAATSTTVAATTTSSTTTTSTTTTTTTTTTSTTIEAATTTTVPALTRELDLRDDGIGNAAFGAAPEGVIEYMRSILGAPTGDTGWVDPFTFATCEGNEVRRVEWGALALLFGDQSPFASGRRHFWGYEYGFAGELGAEPQGLRTAGGVGLGSRVVDVRAEFPEVSINPGDEDGLFLPNFYVSDSFNGILTGPADDDTVTVIFGGHTCGE